MTGYTDFVAMTRTEARSYLERFLAETPDRLAWLADLSAGAGGPKASDLDFSVESVDALWEWAVPRLAWRTGYQPPTSAADVRPRFNPNYLEGPAELPSWFRHPSGVGLARFSADTLWLIDALARYVGEVAIRCIPGSRWASGSTRPKGNMVANQPVLAGSLDEASPIHACVEAVDRTLSPLLEPETLGEILMYWRSTAQAGTK
ncbi:hypothetical protein E8D34_10065 [Nocardioides sp. GY 10113]|uniref:hypothetical protein n=1 Tax=Nocardioides sp. GY 10113 TaxID=2569761 RepID=UPI0010A81958|nr:hypothetical protein [Nocardioides sp. GY 10113]TIC87461.1 hypothetical protein E8D34_10065 [Nocardioides sp. GY 10113]